MRTGRTNASMAFPVDAATSCAQACILEVREERAMVETAHRAANGQAQRAAC